MESDNPENEEKLNVCPVCLRDFGTVAGLRQHWTKGHSTEEIVAAVMKNTQMLSHQTTSSTNKSDVGTLTTIALRDWNKLQIMHNGVTQQFDIIENKAGGDCLFMSIMEFLKNRSFTNVPNDFNELRKMAVSHISTHDIDRFKHSIITNLKNEIPGLLKSDAADDICFDNYVNYMSSPGKYGTEAELCALSELFGFDFNMIRQNNSNEFTSFVNGPTGTGEPEARKECIHLLFTGNIARGHFRLLHPTGSIRGSNMPPGRYQVLTDYTSSRLITIAPKPTFTLQTDQQDTTNDQPIQGENTSSTISIDDSTPRNGLQHVPVAITDDPNNVACPRCIDRAKVCKGLRGLRIHYSLAHKDFLSDLAQFDHISSQNINHLQTPCDLNQLEQNLMTYKQTIRVLKRIPNGVRLAVATKLEELINSCTLSNDIQSYGRLLSFSYIALQVPKRSSKKNKLTSIIRNNISNFDCSPVLNQVAPRKATLAKRVENKISEGDIRGAVKLLTSNDDFAPQNQETLDQLRLLHPSPIREVNLPNPPSESDTFLVSSVEEVRKAILSFPNGSSSGIDGLRPQILKDLLSKATSEAGNKLLSTITKFCNVMLSGKVNENIVPVIYGASLCALNKKTGGVRPIAIGNTWRRLTAKLACGSIRDPIGDYLRPKQLGFATRGGCEAAIHATRTFLSRNKGKAKVLLKIDFRNAFNSMYRDNMLHSIKDKVPLLYPFLRQCYSVNTHLFFGYDIILSQMGVQQGDPCGPLSFCLVIQPLIESLMSELNIWYLDDGTLAGDSETVITDFIRIIDFCKLIGLEINSSKCELFFCSSYSQEVFDKFDNTSPGIQVITSDLTLLGAPLTDSACEIVYNKKLEEFRTMCSRLLHLNHHIAYFMLKHCFAIPKLTFLLRTSPFWKFQQMVNSFDDLSQKTMQQIANTKMDSHQWILASLPVRHGGIGIRRVSDISIPSFLSSVTGVFSLICAIIPSIQTDLTEVTGYEETLAAWNVMCPNCPSPINPSFQQHWDAINIDRISKELTFNSESQVARYKASLHKESGAWLTVLPSKNIGTLLDNNTFRISVSLRFGCDICVPHRCICGAFVDKSGTHGLSCMYCAGRWFRHFNLNDTIKRGFNSAEIPARLEPDGLCRTDGKRPDGMTMVPWSNGQILVWDATCVDTLAPSYVKKSSVNSGSVAKLAANRKRTLYREIIEQNYLFIPFAFETLGPWCEEASDIINSLGTRIVRCTGESKAKWYLIQKISIIIQRTNAASIMGTLPASEKVNEVYFLL